MRSSDESCNKEKGLFFNSLLFTRFLFKITEVPVTRNWVKNNMFFISNPAFTYLGYSAI